MLSTFEIRKILPIFVTGILSTIILSNGLITSTFGLSSNTSVLQENLYRKINK